MSVPRTLFVGRGRGAVAWYRCALPAMVLGQDWIGVGNLPGDLAVLTGLTAKTIREEDFDGYDVLVLQQPAGKEWREAVRRWEARGIVVLFEIDDWLRGSRRMRPPAFPRSSDKA